MPDLTDTQAIIDAAREGVEPFPVPGLADVYIVRNGDEMTDLDLGHIREDRDPHPRRKAGRFEVTRVESLLEYLERHATDSTETWADPTRLEVRAEIDGHGTEDAGWRQHVVTLRLPASTDWREWRETDRTMIPQSQFAEFIEDHLHTFVTPAGADMMEIAQSIQASTSGVFKSSQRLKSGETAIFYVEEHTASAGRKGELSIPDRFTVRMPVFEGGELVEVSARLRYRIAGGQLTLGYRLDRPSEVQGAAFDDVLSEIRSASGLPVMVGIVTP